MSLKDALTTYFPQLLVLLGAIGSLIFYFIKRRYDLTSKKAEIKFSLFQQNKISAIQEFISCCKLLEQTITDTAYHKVLKNIYTTEGMDARFRPPINKLTSAYSNLFLYFDKSKLVPYAKIFEASISIYDTLTGFYFDSTPETFYKDMGNLTRAVEGFSSSNEKLIQEIGEVARRDFDSSLL
jgi:hypothetical protein